MSESSHEGRQRRKEKEIKGRRTLWVVNSQQSKSSLSFRRKEWPPNSPMSPSPSLTFINPSKRARIYHWTYKPLLIFNARADRVGAFMSSGYKKPENFSVLWLLLSCSFSFAVESDINCLKSIKHSLEDPLGNLNSWDFSNNTQELSDLGLKGSFPWGLANCTSLTVLDLSRNQLNGPLPTDIDQIITFVTVLDLSSNSFTGPIPIKLSNCSYLNELKLDNNKFSGTIPPELGQLRRIKTFSVANNQLSGQVPNFNYASITADSLANNPGLCGKPLEVCRSAAKKSSIVKVLNSYNVAIAAAAGFGFGFPFSFCFFLPRAPSVRYLVVFARRFKS
ncbi:unnamed protein product [Prunus armeniaca]|uniref:Leucine-rich repeat-containing N-terminal plant-type domain-containing protein n=1 Tax=Prunus armeniaca TaxID=36596 RepID=A0A6J5VYV5_PRUAR|nr:unnamed protein product [Prunus armeniaca]